jgi:hypothetical protein
VERVKRAELIAVGFTLLWSVVAGANTCVAPKPARISGALCGRSIDATGASVPDVGLRVLGADDRVVADVRADAKGDFIFSGLTKGKYRLTSTTTGWLIEFGAFEIKSSSAACSRPVTVRLDTSCCCFGSGISNERPAHY